MKNKKYLFIERGVTMATLMQKDVLLEGVFQALGYVISKDPNSEERKLLLNMKSEIYSSKPENLNFDEMIQSIKKIIEKYKG